MGKGSRSRELRNSEVKTAAKTAAKKDNTGKIVGIICLILAVIVAGILCVNSFLGSGVTVRNTVSITTTNYQINNAMVSYYFNSIYQNYLSTYSSYISYLGLDTTKSLKSQSAYDGQTWFQYFMDNTKSQMKELTLMAEAAKEAGFEIDADAKAQISEVLSTLKSRAKSAGMEYSGYLKANFGAGVNDEVITKCVELEILANKYLESFRDSLAYTDDDYNKYVEENRTSLLMCDYKRYTVYADVYEDQTEEQKAEIMAQAKAVADSLAAAGSADEFDSILRAYLTEEAEAELENNTDETAETEGIDIEEIEETIAATYVEGTSYTISTDFGAWAFADDRKAGDTTVIEGTESYTAYYMVNPAHIDETLSRNVRRILFYNGDYENDDAAKAKAEEVLAEFTSAGKTVEKFTELAKLYSYDTGTAEDGGLYENYCKEDDYGSEFDSWVYAEDRKVGDAEVVVNSDYGYDILFYESDGLATWKVAAKDALTESDYDAMITELESKYSYTVDDEKLNQIDA